MGVFAKSGPIGGIGYTVRVGIHAIAGLRSRAVCAVDRQLRVHHRRTAQSARNFRPALDFSPGSSRAPVIKPDRSARSITHLAAPHQAFQTEQGTATDKVVDAEKLRQAGYDPSKVRCRAVPGRRRPAASVVDGSSPVSFPRRFRKPRKSETWISPRGWLEQREPGKAVSSSTLTQCSTYAGGRAGAVPAPN